MGFTARMVVPTIWPRLLMPTAPVPRMAPGASMMVNSPLSRRYPWSLGLTWVSAPIVSQALAAVGGEGAWVRAGTALVRTSAVATPARRWPPGHDDGTWCCLRKSY